MLDAGTLAIRLVAQAEQFERTMVGAQRTFDSVVKGFERTARQLESAGRTLMMWATAPLALLGGAALKAAGDLEQAQVAFTNMLGSAEAARDFLGQLDKFARKTPFERIDLRQQTQMLMAFGWSAEDVIPTLTAVGDAVAAAGGNAEILERVLIALGQMRAKGRVTAEEMMQLVEARIPAWELLAQATGKTTAELMRLAQKGLLPARDAIAAMLKAAEQRYKGLMATMSATLPGAWSNLRDAIGSFAERLGKAIDQTFQLKQRIQWLADTIGAAADAFERLNPALRSAIVRFGLAVALVGPVVFGLGVMVRVMGVAVTGMGILSGLAQRASFAFAAWRGGTATLGEALVYLARSRLRLVLLGISALVAATLLIATHWRQLAAFARAVWAAVGAAALYGASLAVRGVGLILAAIGAIIPAVRGAAQAVLGLADSLKGAAAQSWALARSALQVAQVGQQAQENQNALADAGKNAANAQQKVAEGIGKAAEAAADNIQSFDEVHQIQEQMAESPAVTMPEMPAVDVAGVAPGIGDIAAALGEQFAGAADAATAAWNRLRQAMEPVNRAVEWIRTNWPTIRPIVEGIASVIMVLLVPALVKGGVEAMIAAGKHVAAWAIKSGAAVTHGATIVGQLLLVAAKWAWAGIQAMLHAGKMVLAWAMQGWEAVKSVAIQVAQFVILGAKWVWLGIVALANAAEMAAAWFIALGPVGWVIATVIALAALIAWQWDWIKEKTLAVWSAVCDWVSERWAWLGSKAVETWEAIKAFFAKWWGELLAIFTGSIGLIVYLIAHNWETIRSKTAEVWTAVKHWLSGIWQNIKDTASNVWQSIVDWVSAKWEAIRAKTLEVWTAVESWLGEVWASIRAKVTEVWEAIRSWVSTKWAELQASTQAIWTSIRDWLYGVWQDLVSRVSSVWESIRSGAANAWQRVKDTILGIWDGIRRGIAACVNRIIDVLNAMIRGMNRISFTVPTWVPIIGGKSWGFNLPLIPYVALAEGGEVVRPVLALLGEAGRETVIPAGRSELADDIRQAVYAGMMDAARVLQATQPSGEREIILRIDGATFARLILPAIIKEGQRQGLQLVVRPQGV